MSLVKAIRQLAYPKHPAMVGISSSAPPSGLLHIVPACIPIFIMRPLRGQLEHATQSVARQLRADGDTCVFWLDTSGWLDVDNTTSDGRDFIVDESKTPATWELTARGNQRVATFLQMHICRYLAQDGAQCSFLPPEIYQGKVFNPETVTLDRHTERSRERKLKELFWSV